VVDCEIESQLSRLMSRENIDKEKAEVMLMAQASREQRLKLNDYLPTDVIENNSKISDLKEKVADLNQKLLSLQ
jgi:dephospho-CoA kinase